MLSAKDIAAINRLFDSGKIINEGSLDCAIQTTKRSRNWLKTGAVLVRAILIDHAFEDGNKRTAAAVLAALCDINGMHCNPDKINAGIIQILKKNITDIRSIERIIKNGIE